MPSNSATQFADKMNVVAASAVQCFKAGVTSGLSRDAAALGLLIAAFSIMRVDGLNEDRILAEAKRTANDAGALLKRIGHG